MTSPVRQWEGTRGARPTDGRTDKTRTTGNDESDGLTDRVLAQWQKISERVAPRWMVGACDVCDGWIVVRRCTRGGRVGLPLKPIRPCHYCKGGHVDRAAVGL